MNFVFISPHFPQHFWRFCAALKRQGVKVLGIADAPYDSLLPQLRDNLDEYYKVDSLEDGNQVLRALGYFTYRYGKIDWLESNNEYWLEQDAWLRTMFHITTGPLMDEMRVYKNKSAMKAVYEQAKVKTAPWILAEDFDASLQFAQKVGFPLIAKPDNGVGANDTYRLSDEGEFRDFFSHKQDKSYILEKYVFGEICSYDALIDSKSEPLYETGNITPVSLVDVVNRKLDSIYMILPELAEDLKAAGRRCAKAFKVRSRSIHFEFFRLTEDQPGIGQKGEIIGLEVNMRPSGGFTADMINFAGSVDIHSLWAQMICQDQVLVDQARDRFYCVFVGRRDSKNYLHKHDELIDRFGHQLVMQERLPDVFSGAMGNYMYLARCKTKDQVDEFIQYATEGV